MKKDLRRIIAMAASVAAIFTGAAGAFPAKMNTSAASGLLAFPGAVGVGKYATGGRGGEVYHVTNLNDSGEGSLRDAVSKPNRIVVFDVSGTIELAGNITIANNVTVAGQTAPGGSGITVKNYKLALAGDNIICRYVSSRPGPYKSTSSGNDAWGGAKGSHSIIDHCSMSFASDEQWGLYSANKYTTVQYSIIGPADSWGGHKKGVHGFGIMMPGTSTFDHNLIVHNVSRNFRGKIGGTETCDFTNNVIYNWAYQTAYGTIGHLNYVNNTLKIGPNTVGGYHYMDIDSSTNPQNFKVYAAGNRFINSNNTLYGSLTQNNWDGIKVKDGLGITKDSVRSYTAFPTYGSTEDLSSVNGCESAEAAYEHVVAFAGNGISSNKRTAIDRQCAEETRTGTGTISGTASYDDADSSQKETINKYKIKCGVTYTYPGAVLKKEITDSDNDGMDDSWELARGLDPADPDDYKGDYCGQGYMNIEYYINDLTVDSFPEGVVKLSPTGTFTPVNPVSAFETIEAESYADCEEVRTEELASGGQNIGYITNGSWAMYRKVDFGDGAQSFTGVISGNPCTIELYLDSMTNAPAASVAFKGTSGFTDYQTISFNIPKISGTHNLYIKFTGGDGYLMNADSFVFGKDAIPLSGKLFTDVKVSADANPLVWDIGYDAQVGSEIFGDRNFTIADMSALPIGAEILKTSCDAKGVTGDAVTFTAGDNMTLTIGLDSRVDPVPAWLDDFTRIRGQYTSSNDVVFNLYIKDVKKGEKVTLGGNGQTYMCVNYTVFAKRAEIIPEYPKGDIDGDSMVGSTDLVTLCNHLLGSAPMTAEQAERADINGDGKVNVFDFVELRDIVTQQSPEEPSDN